MEISEKVLFLGARQYRFTNRDTGELVEGTTVEFGRPYPDQDGKGYTAGKGSLPLEAFDSLPKEPRQVTAKFMLRPKGQNGKEMFVKLVGISQ